MVTISIQHPGGEQFDQKLDNVAGHLLFAVVRDEQTAELKVETVVAVNASNKEDYDVIYPFIKGIEDKLKEFLPEPVPETKLWVPDGD